jgi:hypothetical protein
MGARCIAPHFLDLATSWMQWVSFTPQGREGGAGTHWIGGWVDPRASVDDAEKRNFLTLPVLELRSSVVQPLASRYTDSAIPALLFPILYLLIIVPFDGV